MEVSAWRAATYGIRINKSDRDIFFKKSWKYVSIDIEGESIVQIGLSPKFWTTCPEIRSARIGDWFHKNGLAPWNKGNPPKFSLIPTGEAKFQLTQL